MISSIKGRVVEQETDSLVVEVGGVGLEVNAPADLCRSAEIGSIISLKTYLVVRENELALYGFSSREEREFFVLLIGVNGVGPRLALAVLSTLTPNAIRRAVFAEQAEIFNRVSGVGKTTAQKILLHLKNKIKDVDGLEAAAVMDDLDTEVIGALTALGYSIVEAQAALQSIPKDAPRDVEQRLRLALAYFSTP
ncbi:MAG TPA: Holliday junction branch migration protein RuvA [Chloroflexi bacterium]|nr:Holliday junction branch migration protein RuvA [Chloroflexota bacterium]